jgi:hypothetical protein
VRSSHGHCGWQRWRTVQYTETVFRLLLQSTSLLFCSYWEIILKKAYQQLHILRANMHMHCCMGMYMQQNQ